MTNGFLTFLAVCCAPAIFAQSLTITTPPSLPIATVNQAYSVQISATGGTTPYLWHFQSGGNPSSRLSLTGDTGIMSGTLTSADLGVLTIIIQVTDATGVTASKQFSVTVQTTQPLSLTTTAFPPGVAGVPYSFQLVGSGGTPPFTWNVLPAIVTFPVPGQVAPGLTLDSATGLVTGTPASAGPFSFTITLTDTAKGSVAKPYTLTVSAGGPLGIVTASLPDGTVGAVYSQTLKANGGVPPYKWSVTTGALPAGLSLDPATGILSGAPTAVAATNFTVTVTDSAATPNTAKQALSVNIVAAAPLSVTTSSLPGGTQGAPYSQKLTSTGGVGPYHWLVSAGTLPAGLNLGADSGIIDGTPTAPGSSAFTLQVADSAAGTPAKATKAFSIAIVQLTSVSVTSSVLAGGTVNTPYSQVLRASGGAAPYSWSVAAGSLPPGLLLSGSGTLSGVPTAAAPFGFTVQVVDSAGGTSVGAITVTLASAPLALVPVTFPAAQAGTPYPPQILNATGGALPYTFSIVGNLPAGLNLTNGVISGTPGSNGTANFTVQVTDADQASASSPQQLAVRSSLPVDLVLSAGSLSFSLSAGATDVPDPQSFTIASGSTSTAPLNYQVAVNPVVPWLTVSGGTATATTPGGISVSLNSAALALAAANLPYTTAITVTCTAPSPCAGSSQKVNVSLNIPSPPALLTLTKSLLSLVVYQGTAQATGAFGIQNSGGGSIAVTSVAAADSWLSVSGAPALPVAAGPATYLTVTANTAALTPGRLYRTTITVATSAGSANLPVTVLVSTSLSITLAPFGQQFQMSAGGAVGNPNGAVQVFLGGGATASWTAATLPGTPWLVVSTPTGTSTPAAPGTLNYSIVPAAAAALASGNYYGRIRVTSGQVTNTPQDFLVVLTVAPGGTSPDPDPEPSGLLFLANGSTVVPPQALTLYASSTTPVSYQAAASTATGVTWLTVVPTSGTVSATAPAHPSISVSPAGLAPGTYRGVVTYQFSAASLRSVNVTYIVPFLAGGLPFVRSDVSTQDLPRANGTCTPTKVVATSTGLPSSFAQPVAWPTPLSVLLSDDCGASIANGTVDVTFSNGDAPLGLAPDPTSAGRYAATWTPRGAVSQVTITAVASAAGLTGSRMQITGRVTPNVAPVLTTGAMLNVFNPVLGGGIAPGTAVQIYGAGLAPPGTNNLAQSLPFPTTLSNTSVVIGGTLAPLYYVSPGQINALAPFELLPGVQYQILVSVNGAITTPDRFISTPGAPGIAAFANGNIIAQHLDATLITDASPAKPGEIIVLYLAGLGSATNQPATGSGAPVPPTDPLNAVTLTLNGATIPTLFVGLTPGTVGLYQIDVTVPPATPDGSLTLTVLQADAVSNVTILPVRH